jgi:hypothetical protein
LISQFSPPRWVTPTPSVLSAQVADFGFAVSQRGEQQHAVGDAFRARQAHCAGCGQQLGNIEKFVGHKITVSRSDLL